MVIARRYRRCLGVLLILASAMPLNAAQLGGVPLSHTKILDQSLQQDGALVGQAIGHDGQPVVGLTVRLHDTNGQVAVTFTDADGRFKFSVTRGGLFAVEAADVIQYRRLWVHQTAPPAVDQGPLQIQVAADPSTVVRGQGGHPPHHAWLTPYRGSWIMLGVMAGAIAAVSSDSDAS